MLRVLLAQVLLLASLACGRSNLYDGHGEVREVDLKARQVVVAHDEIPGLMSAMTMTFDVPDAELLAQLAPGQHIDFELEVSEKSFRIVSARSEDAKAGASRKPSMASALGANELAPDFSLVDQAGRGVSLVELRGQVLVVDFIFTRCTGPCPIMTARNVELQRSLDSGLRERVRFVSISLDPARDTPEAMRQYATARGADLARWSFLTGAPGAVADVLERYGVGAKPAANGEIEHLVITYLIDAEGRIVRRFAGLEHRAETLVAALAAVDRQP